MRHTITVHRVPFGESFIYLQSRAVYYICSRHIYVVAGTCLERHRPQRTTGDTFGGLLWWAERGAGDTVLHLTTKHTIGLYNLVFTLSFQLNLKVKQPAVLEVAIHDPSSPLPKSKRSVIIKLFVTVVFSIYLSMWLASRAQQLSPSGLPAAAHAHEGEVCAHDSFVITAV